MEHRTLPQWCAERAWPLDLTRKILRQVPELRALGTWAGSVRVFAPAEADRIGEAVAKRLAARRAVAAN